MASIQGSLADVWVDPRMGSNRRLEAINALLDWAPLERLGADGAAQAGACGSVVHGSLVRGH